ncbi:GNAT family N-acetyltransferase [Nocardioides zeicaulis]|uniref:GNAT family N-acetyltransferase n=1 Tax=Nocardioides zeicaulis TaxID=1776857 RepID=A0ABV6E5J0_9ACTN
MGLPLTVADWPPAPIRTERLLLRPPEARDRPAFVDLGCDPVVNRFTGGGRERATLEREMPAVPADRPGQLVVEHEGRLVGWFGVSRHDPARPGRVLPDGGELELSWVTPVAAWGHGWATEAGRAVLAWVDARFDEPVVVCTQVANTASRRLAARLGFTEAGRFEEHGALQWFGVRHPGTP